MNIINIAAVFKCMMPIILRYTRTGNSDYNLSFSLDIITVYFRLEIHKLRPRGQITEL